MHFLRCKRFLTPLLALLVALAIPAAGNAQGAEVIRDCAQDGDLDGNYSQEELDNAYENLPSDIDEYSDCREIIEKARERGGAGGTNNAAGSPIGGGVTGSGSGGSSSGGGSLGGSGNDVDELGKRQDRARADEAPDASVSGRNTSASSGALETGATSSLPAPLIVAIILALLAGIAGALYLLRDRLPPGIASKLPGPLKG